MRGPLVLAGLVLGLAAACLGSVELFYAAPLRAETDGIDTLAVELGDIRQRLAEAKAEYAVISNTAPAPIEDLVIEAADAAAATALLQDRVRGLALQSGGSILSSIGDAADLPGLGSKVTVTLQSRFDEQSLMSFLHNIELARPPILIDAVTVQPLPVADRAPLDARLSFVGFHVHSNAP